MDDYLQKKLPGNHGFWGVFHEQPASGTAKGKHVEGFIAVFRVLGIAAP
jgi:hypothetical protein